MITEVVTFKLPQGMTREDVVAAFRKSAPTWRANPDLEPNFSYLETPIVVDNAAGQVETA